MIDYKNIAWISLVLGMIILSTGVGPVLKEFKYYIDYNMVYWTDIARTVKNPLIGAVIAIIALLIIYP